jgi:hypothetical protein
MMPWVALTAALNLGILTTESFSGEVEAEGGDYVIIEFEVPEGTVELEIRHETLSSRSILDWGVWDPDGFRGWSGGLTAPIVIGEQDSSRGYLPGPIQPGTWQLVIGKAKILDPPVRYEVEVEYRDEAVLEPRVRATYEPVTLEAGPRWYRGDFHVHSRESGDATAELEEIVALARERGLDFVVLTDHNTVSQIDLIAPLQAATDDVLLLRGIEVTTYAGHGNALGVVDYVDHRVGLEGLTISDVIADVRAQGGLFSISHPALALGDLCIGCAWTYDDTPWNQVNAIEIHTGPYEFAGLFAGHAISMWEEALDRGHLIAAVGGSDDHRAGRDLSATQSPIGSPTTLVWAEELSEQGILAGVAAGRTIVNFRGPDDPGLALEIEGAGERAGIGDRIAAPEVRVHATAKGGEGFRLAVYRNGTRVESLEIDAAEFAHTWTFETAEDGDRYRVEIREGSIPVVVTSHVFVDYAARSGRGCVAAGSTGGAAALLLAAAAAFALSRRRNTC